MSQNYLTVGIKRKNLKLQLVCVCVCVCVWGGGGGGWCVVDDDVFYLWYELNVYWNRLETAAQFILH